MEVTHDSTACGSVLEPLKELEPEKVPRWRWLVARHLERPGGCTPMVRLSKSKDGDYLRDNLCMFILSGARREVKQKAGRQPSPVPVLGILGLTTLALGSSCETAEQPRPLAKNARRAGHPHFWHRGRRRPAPKHDSAFGTSLTSLCLRGRLSGDCRLRCRRSEAMPLAALWLSERMSL